MHGGLEVLELQTCVDGIYEQDDHLFSDLVFVAACEDAGGCPVGDLVGVFYEQSQALSSWVGFAVLGGFLVPCGLKIFSQGYVLEHLVLDHRHAGGDLDGCVHPRGEPRDLQLYWGEIGVVLHYDALGVSEFIHQRVQLAFSP